MAIEVDDILEDLNDNVVIQNQEEVIDAIINSFDNKSNEEIGECIDTIISILAGISNIFLRNKLIEKVSKATKISKTSLNKEVNKKIKDLDSSDDFEINDLSTKLPNWAQLRAQELFEQLFLQNEDPKVAAIGIYFKQESMLQRLTNFTVKPLYQIVDPNNGRRILEIKNRFEIQTVEMPNRGMISSDSFFMELINKGAYTRESGFGNNHFLRLISVIATQMPKVWELKTLGWQSEGFFAFANIIVYNNELLSYNELGIVEIDSKYYLSPGVSNMRSGERESDNIYENDLFLKYVHTTETFSSWAKMFYTSYGFENAPLGIAFVFISLFKDIIVNHTKCPLLYCYGQKGSGKSEFAESVTNLFYSGKDSNGQLIKPYNLNPGQGTPFSFFNKQERFSNTPGLYNEFDENNIEDYKFGAFKASYDGEGREVGDGSTGKARRTKIQKVKGTNIIVGQYLSTKDDGSVTSRSLACEFTLGRLDNITEEQNENHKKLKNLEKEGISSIVVEILKYREAFAKAFSKVFWRNNTEVDNTLKDSGIYIETRLMRNYMLAYSVLDVMNKYITLPFELELFKKICIDKMISHNKLLKNNNALNHFWKIVEFMMDSNVIHPSKELDVVPEDYIKLADGSNISFAYKTYVLYVRLGTVYNYYAKIYKERTGKPALNQDTLEMYLKDQVYFLGPIRSHRFKDKSTSCVALLYEKIGVNLLNEEIKEVDLPQTNLENIQKDLPI